MSASRLSLADQPHDRAPRADLAHGVAADEVQLRGARVAIGALPLFRERDGRLEQAVRVALDAPERATVTISTDGELLDRAELDGPGRALVFVPEVERPRAFVVELSGALTHRHEVTVAPQRKWEVAVVHHSHLDIGYTDPQPLVLRQHLAYLDAVLDHAAATDGWPAESRFRWTVEANLPLTQWLESRPAADREALLERVREGRVEVCALPFTMHTEALSLEELARTLWPAQALRERHGIEIVTAMQTDVPGATLGLCELLAAAGVRYLSVAHNYAGRSVPHLNGGQRLRRPFWWRAPSGRRLLVWHTDSPHGIAYMEGNLVGLAEGYEATLTYLPEYLLALATRPYPYSPGATGWLTGIQPGTELTRAPQEHELLHLRVQGTIADNACPSRVPAEVVRAWNERWAYPRLRTATNRDFFTAAAARLGDTIPTYEGDWTDWWADGIASAARELGEARRAQDGVRAAQTLHAVADALGDDGVAWRADVARAYEELALFDEHTWGSANPWADRLERMDAGALQWRWKAARADAAAERVEALLESGRARMAARVAAPVDAHAGVLVLNPSSHSRTDEVELLLPEARLPLTRDRAVVDVARGERVPCALEPQPWSPFRPRGQRLRFLARDVPACGFASYAIVADRAGVPEPVAGDPARLETDRFAAALDVASGCLTSLTDGVTGIELVNGDSAFGFNQYIHDRYATAPRVNHLSSRVGGAAGLWLLAAREVAGDGALLARTGSPLEERATVRLRAPGAHALTVTYRLLHGADRLDVLDVVDKAPGAGKEAVFFAFPFAARDPRMHYEITGGVHTDGAPTVPGSAQHMRAVRRWVAVEDGERAIGWGTREAALVQVGNLHLPYAPFPPTVDPDDAGAGTVFSWAMNNGWDTNFPPDQSGETRFAYAVTSAAAGADVRALGAAAGAPPLVGVLSSPRASDGLPERGTLCALDHPHVELLAIGPSRRGTGLVALLHSHAAEPVEVTVAFPDLPVTARGVGDHLERELRPLDGPVRIAPGELLTIALEVTA